MLECVCQVVLATDNVTNLKIDIVRTRSKVISRHAGAAQQREVLDVRSRFPLVAVNRIDEPHFVAGISRNAIAQCERLTRGGPAITLVSGKLAHARIEQPRSMGCGTFAIVSVRRREVAISKSLIEDLPRDTPMQFEPLGLLVLLVPSKPEPFQAFKNRVHRGFCVALHICVIQTQNHRPLIAARIKPVEDESARTSHVQKSGGRRCKTHSWLAVGNGGVGDHRRTHRWYGPAEMSVKRWNRLWE